MPSNGRGKNSASLDWFLPKAAPFGAAFEIRFDSHDTKKEMHPFRVHLFFGGGEGSRTPVRKRFNRTFSGRSYDLGIPSSTRHATDAAIQ